MKKFFSFVLVCFLLILSLSFGAFADYDGNLINPDLTSWQVLADSSYGVDIMRVAPYGSGTSTFKSQMYSLQVQPSTSLEASGVYIWFGALLDGVKLIPGNSYTFSFYLPNGTDVWQAIGEPEGAYKDQFFENNNSLKHSWANLHASLSVGISYGDSFTIDSGVPLQTELLDISYENIDSYFGKEISASFLCPDYTGNAYLTFIFGGNSKYTNSFLFYFSDVSLIDPNAEDEKGFLAKQFDRLINLILYFDVEGNYTNPFDGSDSPLHYISGYFDKLINYVSESVESITVSIDSASGMIHIFDLLTKRFGWLLGLCVFTLAVLVYCRFIGL